MVVNIVSFATINWSPHAMHSLSLMGIEDIKWWDQTKAVSTVSVALMHFIFAQKYLDNRDNRPQNASEFR